MTDRRAARASRQPIAPQMAPREARVPAVKASDVRAALVVLHRRTAGCRLKSRLVGWARAPDADRVVSVSDPLALGRAALGRAAWSQTGLHFEEADATDATAEAWEGLSRAAWWQGDQITTLSARERAYRAYLEADDMCGAARMAMWLASDHLDFRGDDAVASAWLARGRALLGDQRPCAEAGFLTVLEADMALLAHSDPGDCCGSGACGARRRPRHSGRWC